MHGRDRAASACMHRVELNLGMGWGAEERPAGGFMQGFAEYNGSSSEAMQGFTRKGHEQPSRSRSKEDSITFHVTSILLPKNLHLIPGLSRVGMTTS